MIVYDVGEVTATMVNMFRRNSTIHSDINSCALMQAPSFLRKPKTSVSCVPDAWTPALLRRGDVTRKDYLRMHNKKGSFSLGKLTFSISEAIRADNSSPKAAIYQAAFPFGNFQSTSSRQPFSSASKALFPEFFFNPAIEQARGTVRCSRVIIMKFRSRAMFLFDKLVAPQ